MPPACAKCAAYLEADWRYCLKCGAAVGSSAPDTETRALNALTTRHSRPTTDPLPFSSLPEKSKRNLWAWVLGLALLAASVVAVATHRDEVGRLAHSAHLAPSSTPVPTKAMEAAISAYYHAIGNQDYDAAYSTWTPSMQKGLTPDDIAHQWAREGATHAQIDVQLSQVPEGDFVGTTVTETDSYPGGYARKQVLKGGWHVVNVNGRWLLNSRDFKTVTDTGPPPNAVPPPAEQANQPAQSSDRSEAITVVRGMYERSLNEVLDAVSSSSGHIFKSVGWDAAPSLQHAGAWVVTYRYTEDTDTGVAHESFAFEYNPTKHVARQISGAIPLEADNAVPADTNQ